jgi:hypothetical protein
MGRVVTTNSATLVNKGLEVIEAHLLFGVDYDRIDVVVHPQSIVHSMVEFIDGSTIAQASPPDMRPPISLGLDWPHRVGGVGRRWIGPGRPRGASSLSTRGLPAVALAKQVGRAGATYPAVFNAANEQAVDAFHAGRLSFPGILDTVQRIVDAHDAPPVLTRSAGRRGVPAPPPTRPSPPATRRVRAPKGTGPPAEDGEGGRSAPIGDDRERPRGSGGRGRVKRSVREQAVRGTDQDPVDEVDEGGSVSARR